jgi:predicted carbohydrate-binding protein with CBM48
VTEFGQDSFIEQIASELRRPVRLDPQFDDRVMEAIEAPEVIPLRPSLPRPWILRPWTISVSPIAALATAAALVLALGLGVWRVAGTAQQLAERGNRDAQLVNVANTMGGRVLHQFLIVAPDARKMEIVGDFNNWDGSRTPMTRVNDEGTWSVSIPLGAGIHQFQFVKDDSVRLNDPTLPQTSSDFGSPNSVINIPLRGR